MLVTNSKRELYRVYFENNQHVLVCVDEVEHTETMKEKKQRIINSFNEKVGHPIAVRCRFYGYINGIEVANFYIPKNIKKLIKDMVNNENNN
jgi:predicted PilT family ATPase